MDSNKTLCSGRAVFQLGYAFLNIRSLRRSRGFVKLVVLRAREDSPLGGRRQGRTAFLRWVGKESCRWEVGVKMDWDAKEDCGGRMKGEAGRGVGV